MNATERLQSSVIAHSYVAQQLARVRNIDNAETILRTLKRDNVMNSTYHQLQDERLSGALRALSRARAQRLRRPRFVRSNCLYRALTHETQIAGKS